MRDFKEQNYYELLDVKPHASQHEVERSYQQALRYFDNDSIATYALFQHDELNLLRRRIEEAFSVLGDPERRKRYDREILRGLDEQLGEGLQEHKDSFQRPATRFFNPEPPVPNQGSEASAEKDQKPSKVPDGLLPEKLGSTTAKAEADSMPSLGVDTVYSGDLLKQMRESKGLSLEKIAAVTRINISNLRNVEEENFDDLPAPAYVRGYVREMAKILGLNPEVAAKSYYNRMTGSDSTLTEAKEE